MKTTHSMSLFKILESLEKTTLFISVNLVKKQQKQHGILYTKNKSIHNPMLFIGFS